LLKYHTFNKRAMVYDTLHNFIGDTHWQTSGGIGEGDEVELEAGVVVQVEEQVGLSETDLRPIFERPRKRGEGGEEERRGVGIGGADISRTVQRPREVLRHKSLNALLGGPKGALGKAVLPTKSPFELKNGTAGEDGSAAKRQRRDTQGPWTVTRVTAPAKATKNKETPLRARMTGARTKGASSTRPARKAAPKITGQMSLKVKEVIDITSENDDNTPSDVALPDTPSLCPSVIPALQPRRTPALPRSWRRGSPSPSCPGLEPMSPPVSTTNKIINVDADTPPGTLDITDVDQGTGRHPPPQSNSRLKPIQLAKSKPRNMLLCETNNPKILKTKSTLTTDPRPPYGVDNGPQVEKRSGRAKQRQNSEKEPHDKSTATSKPGRHQIRSVVESIRHDETPSVAFSPMASGKMRTEKSTANTTSRARTKEQMRQSENEIDGARKKAGSTAQTSIVLSEQLEAKRKDQEKGPWTVEALDFFDWRPPDWDARVKQMPLELESRV
jgi:hypothetical protein